MLNTCENGGRNIKCPKLKRKKIIAEAMHRFI